MSPTRWRVREAALQLVALALLAVLLAASWESFWKGGGRTWWWSSIVNDSCQCISAQSASMRLGAPMQTVVWPGATLAAPYLCATALEAPIRAPLSIEATADLLSEAVRFHRVQAFVLGAGLLVVVYGLALRWSGSVVLAAAVSGLVAINPWFLYGLFAVRPEIPSLVFALLACGWSTLDRPTRWPVVRPAVFGGLVALALLTKFQVALLLPFAIWIFVVSGAPAAPQASGWRRFAADSACAALGLVVAACMLKTRAIEGSTFKLPIKESAFSQSMAAVTAILSVTTLAVSCGPWRRASATASSLLRAGGGAVAAMGLVLLPIMIHGGWWAFIASANRVVYGTLTFARYGLEFGDIGGWQPAIPFAEKVTRFMAFQSDSGVIDGNLALWVFVQAGGCMAVAAMAPRRRRCAPDAVVTPVLPNRREGAVMLWLLGTAVLFDIATCLRITPRYHVYSMPLYLLASATSFGAVFRAIRPQAASSAAIPFPRVVLLLAIGAWGLSQLRASSWFELWGRNEDPPLVYLDSRASTVPIQVVAPEFWKRTGCNHDELRKFVVPGAGPAPAQQRPER